MHPLTNQGRRHTIREAIQKILWQSCANTNQQANGILSFGNLDTTVRPWDLSNLPKSDLQNLKIYHEKNLHQILENTCWDRITNNEVLRAMLEDLQTTMTYHWLRWTGHIARMLDICLHIQILFSELASGKIPRGSQLCRYKNQLKDILLRTEIDLVIYEIEAGKITIWEERKKLKTNRRAEENLKKSHNPPYPENFYPKADVSSDPA